ncbi:MAG: nuclear transport factor 2 family protein [Anaerolineae bacterium]|nr:nuclear transport factor 2 family protein [Anaerolineae bacterium]
MNLQDEATLQDIRAVLNEFQLGYTERDLDALDDFVELFAPGVEVEVIGTGGVVPGDEEWCAGREMVQELIANDWEYWGDVVIDVDDARIRVVGDVAWVSAPGTVTDFIKPAENCEDFFDYAIGIMQATSMPVEERMYEIMRQGMLTLAEARKGESYIWPFRFTAVLVREKRLWRFYQVQFSFPTTHFPHVRFTGVETEDFEGFEDEE